MREIKVKRKVKMRGKNVIFIVNEVGAERGERLTQGCTISWFSI